MGKVSQINGKNFEMQLCNYFAKKGYFCVYNNRGNAGEQPCDIIIIKDNIANLIEAKNLTNQNGLFPVARIEQNQIFSYKRFKSCNNTNFLLMINWNNNVYSINFADIDFNQKSIDLKEKEICFTLNN